MNEDNQVLATLTAAWIVALSARRGEDGYSDAGVNNEAAILAIGAYKALAFHVKAEANP